MEKAELGMKLTVITDYREQRNKPRLAQKAVGPRAV